MGISLATNAAYHGSCATVGSALGGGSPSFRIIALIGSRVGSCSTSSSDRMRIRPGESRKAHAVSGPAPISHSIRSDNFFGKTIRLPASAVTCATKASIYHILPIYPLVSPEFLLIALTITIFYHISTISSAYVYQATRSWAAEKIQTAKEKRIFSERHLLYWKFAQARE